MKYLILLILITCTSPLIASEVVTNKAGERIQLNDDGTWEKVEEAVAPVAQKKKMTEFDRDQIKVEGERQRLEAIKAVELNAAKKKKELNLKRVEADFRRNLTNENNGIEKDNKIAKQTADAQRKAGGRVTRAVIKKLIDIDKEWEKVYKKSYKKHFTAFTIELSSLKRKKGSYKPAFKFTEGSYGHITGYVIPYKVIDGQTMIVSMNDKVNGLRYLKLKGIDTKERTKKFKIFNCLKCTGIEVESGKKPNMTFIHCDILPK